MIVLDGPGWQPLIPELVAGGSAVAFEGGHAVFPALFWQGSDR